MQCSLAVPRLRTVLPLAALVACALVAPQARAESRVDNPFAGADWYVSPAYAKSVGTSIDQVSDATLKKQMTFVASQPTAFWLDRIAAIQGVDGGMGLAAHLDAALSQQKSGKPMVVMVVVYDLPGRDCSALASNGELGPTDIDKYKAQFIDPIAAIEGNAKYASLRIVNVIEIDSLPNIVTNTDVTLCQTMSSNGNYVTGIQYALSKLYAAGTNIYNYIDAAHHGWIGWKSDGDSSNFIKSANLFAKTAKGATGGVDTVTGFIANTANYSALVEPFITSPLDDKYRNTTWFDWNNYGEESKFAIDMRTELISLGFNSNLGMLIDTSRNGWGGSARPTVASSSTDANTFVEASRTDRRIHAGNWCNQTGAGLGERPRVVGQDGIHAYVWVKPPGESDGSDTESGNGKGIDRMCDPTYHGNVRNKNNLTGAMAGAPLSGKWFHAQFIELIKNANPVIPGDVAVPTPTPVPTGNPTPTPTPTPSPTVGDFQLTVSPSSLTLNQGDSGSSTILVGTSGGFSGTVALSASGLPSGVTATFSPSSASSQSTLTLTASSSAATGTSTVTITGTSGSLSHTATLSLTVNTAGSPSFTLSASPSSLAIDRGASGSTAISVQAANGFSGSVALAAQGLPDGVTASFNPQSASSSSTVTFQVSSTASAGSSTVTIVGTSGSLSEATTVSLTVNSTGGAAGFSLSASPVSVVIPRGSSGSTSVSVSALGGFTGSVSLSASGAPSSVTVAFNPSSASPPGASTVTFSVASSASDGAYPIAINGASGSITGATTVWVIVTDASSGGGADAGHASGSDGGTGGAAAGGCGCAVAGPADAAIGSFTLLAAMMLWVRRRSY